ncbi:hypothetical protein PIB30_099494, partial [Stylosanthes scabra]|nr:hypothetical protein [Stylosanthes scabra]
MAAAGRQAAAPVVAEEAETGMRRDGEDDGQDGDANTEQTEVILAGGSVPPLSGGANGAATPTRRNGGCRRPSLVFRHRSGVVVEGGGG